MASEDNSLSLFTLGKGNKDTTFKFKVTFISFNISHNKVHILICINFHKWRRHDPKSAACYGHAFTTTTYIQLWKLVHTVYWSVFIHTGIKIIFNKKWVHNIIEFAIFKLQSEGVKTKASKLLPIVKCQKTLFYLIRKAF